MSEPDVPDGFECFELGQVCRPRQWPTLSQEELSDHGFTVYGANGLIGYYHRYTHENPTIAITCRGSTCGEVHLTSENSYITGNAMALDDLDTSKLDERYATYFLKRHGLKECITGSAQPQIIGSALRQVVILAPSITEQQKIAQLLDTLDTQIHQTEALIAKLERIKQGLLTDLLTRGIDKNGELRPPPEEAPHLYKDSPLGWIPREWVVSTIGNEFEIQLGKMLDAEKNVGELKPYLGNKSIQWERIDLSELGQIRLTASDQKRFRLRNGDLLVCEGGEVGRAAIWEDQIEECYYQKALHRLRPKRGFRTELMLQLLRYWTQRDMLAIYTSQTSIAHLSKERLEVVPLVVPPLDEQTLIVDMLHSYQRRERLERNQLGALSSLKSGLMDDLLTGRVRVTPLLGIAKQAYG